MARVREARLEDAPGIAKVHVDSWRTTYRGIVPGDFLARLSYEGRERNWARVLTTPNPGECTFVAEDDWGQIVGFASGGPERTGDPKYQGELYAIYLLQTHQRKGIGACLTLSVVERLVEQGKHSLLVWVLADNPSRGFYTALGGQFVRKRQIEIGGVNLDEVAYGWTDAEVLLTFLRSRCRDETRT